ncbi:MAG TPA: GNAT family N-acetyltransferase [Ferrovibrio sp.]|uniref:GNAT family N-acetyltransferase n=1 Tax=Ferrovibrio sp. TaxID=1917215 RepID=UPI002ED06308
MATTEALGIGRLGHADLPAALGLSAEAGWNQTADDWRLFLDHGRVFACRNQDGMPMATAAILPYGRFAWISMVLVTAGMRQRGLGTALLKHCIAELRRDGLTPLLDATPAGEHVYLPLGFKPIFGMTRWQGETARQAAAQDSGRNIAGPIATATAMDAGALGSAAMLDAAAFGAPREFLLQSLLGRAPDLALRLKEHSFVLARPGRLATQIGPLVANDEAAALALLQTVLARLDGPVFLDVPDRWQRLQAALRQLGCTVQRSFRRMALGRDEAFGDPARCFVVAGPEFG